MVQPSAFPAVRNGESAGSWDLVAAAQAGDRQAFGQLYQRYAPEVARFVTSRTGDHLLAEDLTSETFARGLRRIDSVHDQGRDLGAWFGTIARNLITDHYKSSRSKLERPVAQIPEADACGAGPDAAVIQHEIAQQVQAAVAALPTADQRECIQRRFFDDLSVSETAAAMSRHPSAVKALTHRALVGLRATLAKGSESVSAQRAVADPLASVRRAVDEAHQRVGLIDQQVADQERAEQLARWHTEERGEVLQQREQDRDALAEGVA